MGKQYYIVWNADKSEGFITDSESDAKQCRNGRFKNPSSCIGNAFYEAYEDDDERIFEKVILP